MKEEKRMGFYKDEQGEKVIGINCIEEINTSELRGKILNVISSKSEYKQIVIFGGLADNHWCYMSLTQFIPIEKIKNVAQPNLLRVYFKYEREGYWIVKGNKDIIDRIKEPSEVIDFEQTQEE